MMPGITLASVEVESTYLHEKKIEQGPAQTGPYQPARTDY